MVGVHIMIIVVSVILMHQTIVFRIVLVLGVVVLMIKVVAVEFIINYQQMDVIIPVVLL